MKLKWTLMLLFAGLLPGLLLAQDKPEKSKQKIVIIKKSVDEDGNQVVEKIVREGEGDEKMEWQDEGGKVIIRLGNDDVEWNSLEDMDIDIDLDGLEEKLQRLDVQLEELDGLKNLKIRIEPDGEVIEWQGFGDIPHELEERLEGKGFHFRSLDGEDFTFETPPNKALLGVQVGQTLEMSNENGEVEEMEVPERDGAAVLDVFKGSAAEEAGIQKGDVITSVDGAPVEGFEALVEALSDKAPGDRVSIGLRRSGQPMTVEATLKGSASAPFVYRFKVDDDDAEHKVKRLRKVIILDDEGEAVEEDEEPLLPEAGKPALELEAFEAFPNPADNQLTVRFTGKPAPVTLLLLDASGKQVYKEYIQDFSGRYSQQIGLEGVPEGLLLLTIEQDGQVFTEKVMVTRQ